MTTRAGPRAAWAAAAFVVFGVGCGDDIAAVAGSSSSDAVTSSGSSSTSTTSSASGATSTGDATTGGVVCDPVEPASVELLVDRPTGLMTRYDVDLDGQLDVVGAHGVVVRHTEEIDEVLAAGVTADALPGRFVDGERPGLVYKPGAQDQLVVVSDMLGRNPTIVVTPEVDPAFYAAGDFDGDALEDALLTTSNSVEIWKGNPDGVFTFYADARGFNLPVTTFFRGADGAVGVAVSSVFADLTILEVSGMQLEEVASLQVVAGSIRSLDPTGGGAEGLLISWWFAQLESYSGVALLFEDSNEWDGPGYSLEGELSYDQAPLDVDDDGDLDLLVLVEGPRLDVLCFTPEAYTLCGRVALPTAPSNIGTLADPDRVVLSDADGTSVMLLPPLNCLE